MRTLLAVAVIALACAPQTGAVAPRTQAPTPRASATADATPSPVRYVAIGASDTVGVGADDPATGSWPARIAARLPGGSSYVNLGVSGSTAREARDQQLARAVAARPTAATVWLAVNDLVARVPPQTYAADLAEIVDPLVRRTDARVFVGTVPDLRAVPAFSGLDPVQLAQAVRAYNAAIERVAAPHGARVTVVDLFTGSAELTSAITLAPDGFHPSDRGYELIAQRFADAMRAGGVPLR